MTRDWSRAAPTRAMASGSNGWDGPIQRGGVDQLEKFGGQAHILGDQAGDLFEVKLRVLQDSTTRRWVSGGWEWCEGGAGACGTPAGQATG